MSNKLDAPRRIIRKGAVSDIPKFCMVDELLKASRYAKFGYSENTSDKDMYHATHNQKLDRVLSNLNGEMTSSQVAEKIGCSQSAVHKWLKKLGELGMVDRRIAMINDRRNILFWKI